MMCCNACKDAFFAWYELTRYALGKPHPLLKAIGTSAGFSTPHGWTRDLPSISVHTPHSLVPGLMLGSRYTCMHDSPETSTRCRTWHKEARSGGPWRLP